MTEPAKNKRSVTNHRARWIILLVAWAAAWSLSIIGQFRFAASIGQRWTWMDVIYRTFQLVELESGSIEGRLDPTLEAARFLLPALAGITALQAVNVFFHRQLSGLRLRFIKDHLVVIGVNSKSIHLLEAARGLGIKCAAIDNTPAQTAAGALGSLGVELIEGDPSDPTILNKARVSRAAHVVCMLGKDADNLRAAMAIPILPGQTMPRRVVELRSSELHDLLKGLAFGVRNGTTGTLESYNEYLITANSLIDLDPAWSKGSSPNTVEIFGTGDLGARLAEKILYTWRSRSTDGSKSITLFDLDPSSVLQDLIERHPEIKQLCFTQATRVDFTSLSGTEQAIGTSDRRPEIVYLCLSDPLLTLRLLLTLTASERYSASTFYIRADERDDRLVRSISASVSQNLVGRVVTFDPAISALTVDMVLGGVSEALARGLYHAYRKQINAQTDRTAWEALSEEEKGQNRNLAARTLSNVARFGYTPLPMHDWNALDLKFSDAEVDAMAALEHAAWSADKRKAGWRAGEYTDPRRKIHADLVSWQDLPENERAKNRRFFIELPTTLANLGYALEKNP